jgi:hypothetical protein
MRAVDGKTHTFILMALISSTGRTWLLHWWSGGMTNHFNHKVCFFYQSGTRMQDIILIQLGFKTSAHTVQLHSYAKIHTKIANSDGIYCRTARKIWAALPLGK